LRLIIVQSVLALFIPMPFCGTVSIILFATNAGLLILITYKNEIIPHALIYFYLNGAFPTHSLSKKVIINNLSEARRTNTN
jgi:hypothetical protein